ncbi:MAG: excinuclease ABC subunit UvrB [Dehalococcoidia bacterium]|nr:excinuclease ABC subunit UvrB [Dehalococcoidia bacterium]
MPQFEITADFELTGDQPQAVNQLVEGINCGYSRQTLLGVTGSGKTFTLANVIARLNRPALVMSHNKTLAAQLYAEFKEFFPHNAVEYFVSYYDYYQPEAYVPSKDMYIEKDADINEEIDKLRHAATKTLLERRDAIIVASVSCIYGLGEPEEYRSFVFQLHKGQDYPRHAVLKRLVEMQYERNDVEFTRGKFRVRGDTLEIQPSYTETGLKFEFFGQTLDRITSFDTLSGEILAEMDQADIFPAKHFVTSFDKMQNAIRNIREELQKRLTTLREDGKLLEAARLETRTNYDLEMMQEVGYCSGIENYSRHLSGRQAGSTPWTLLDYFPEDFITIIDESHMSLPQIRGMFRGDYERKKTLVDFGFRLPSALDNRPLSFDEFNRHMNQMIYVSATPAEYELKTSQQVVEQLVRPTGLLEPTIVVKPTKGQIDDLLEEIKKRTDNGTRCLVTTLTKKLAERLADYLAENGIKTHYLHSEMDTFERVEILRDLRLGIYDVVVGINLLREGLDLPEVSLVVILDADKEGYLRSEQALIQTMGRAARHIEGHVIMYADKTTGSMERAMGEINRRRAIQEAYNTEHGITPQGIKKAIKDITERVRVVTDTSTEQTEFAHIESLSAKDKARLIDELEKLMRKEAKNLNFEKAALLRDRLITLRRALLSGTLPQ